MKKLIVCIICIVIKIDAYAQDNPYQSFGYSSSVEYQTRALAGADETNKEERYRFSFNGQEKDEDIEANHYTALYWEYDSRIGRRWNPDPRPVTSISNYATFANNPISMSDSNGDTAVIRWKTGFLRLGRTEEARYVNGQWIDSRTRNVIDRNLVSRSGVIRMMQDYETLNGISEFNPVTNRMNTARNLINLRWSGRSETDTKTYFEQLLDPLDPNSFPEIKVTVGGASRLSKRLYAGGDNRQTTYMVLGHELGHAFDLLNSGRSERNFRQIAGLAKGISLSERNSMYWENVLRAKAGFGLRLCYHYDASATPAYQLSSNTKGSGAIQIISDLRLRHNTRLYFGHIIMKLRSPVIEEEQAADPGPGRSPTPSPVSNEGRAQTGRDK